MVKRSFFEAFLTGMVLVLMLTGPAWAADPPKDPLDEVPMNARESVRAGAVDELIPPAPEKPVAPLPEIVIQEETDQPLQDSGVKFQLNNVTFEETLIFSPNELRDLVKGWIGKTITVGELQNLTGAVTKFYREEGYFLTRAYLPPQTIKEGVVAIAVREGRLGDIIIKGNKRYSRDLIRNTLKIIRGEGAIRTDDVERALLLLMDNPGLTVKVTFKPGARPGTSDIVLEATEGFPLSVQFDYDNFGSKFVSEHRGGITFTANNPVGLGDALTLRGVMGISADSLMYGRAEYVLPLGYSGLRLGVFYNHLQYDMGSDLEDLNGGGESNGAGIWLRYPIIRSRTLNWFVDGGCEAKNVNQFLNDKTIGADKVRQAYLGTSLQWLDTIGGYNVIAVRGYQGFSHLLRGMDQTYTDTIRLNTEVVYNKVEAELTRIQSFPYNFSLLLRGAGVYSADRLPSSEQLHVGGMGSVRGYSAGEYSGDAGMVGTAELRIPILGQKAAKYVQLAGFYDAGKLWICSPFPAEKELDGISVQGAGAGLRIAFPPYFKMKVDWARSVGSKKPYEEADRDNGIWYVQATLAF